MQANVSSHWELFPSPRFFLLYAPAFFPRLHHGADLDHEGEELPDRYAAWREATITAGQMMANSNLNMTGVWK
jgi:hypothetical protein